MSLPRTLPLHPVDLLCGTLIPEPQTYLVAAPAFDLDPARVYSRLAPLITGSFARLSYRFPRRLGTYADLILADAPTAPVRVLDPDTTPGTDPLAALAPTRPLDDRHWELTVFDHEGLTVFALRFDHVLGHGELARRFLISACDALRDGEKPSPPVLTPTQSETFRQLQERLIDQAHASASWATYRRLELDGAGIRRLVRAMGLSFTDGLTIWLAYHLQATARAGGRNRPLDALCFRMAPTATNHPQRDPGFGNDGLSLQRWQMDPDGSFERLDRGSAKERRALERFSEIHRALPAKPLLNAALGLALAAIRRSKNAHRDNLVVNNLGPTDFPFFRPVFFDPSNDCDQFGLVYVDGHQDRVRLQLTPPRRYLSQFSWDDFEQRLYASLADPEGWVAGR